MTLLTRLQTARGSMVPASGPSQTMQRALLESNLATAQAAAAPSNPNNHVQPQPLSDQTPVSTPSSNPRASSSSHALDSFPKSRQASSAQEHTDGQGLQSLSLSGCCKVTDKGVAALQRGSPAARSLTCLDVSGCLKLTGAALDVSPKVSHVHIYCPLQQ